MAKRVWTMEEKDTIKNMYTVEGATITEIRKLFKVRDTTISNILKELGVPINRASKNRFARHDYFQDIDSEDKAYFLGLMIADGNVTLDKERMRSPFVRLELIDLDVLKQLEEVANTKTTMSPVIREGRNLTYVWSLRSKKMAEDLAKYGVVPNKTKLVSGLYQGVEDHLVRHYVRGLVDGDGSIYWSSNMWHVSFTSGNRESAEQIQQMFMDLTGKRYRKKVTSYNGIYKITYDGLDAVNLLNILYNDSNFYINRKKETARLSSLLD